MKKETYNRTELDIIIFNSEDVITTSLEPDKDPYEDMIPNNH